MLSAVFCSKADGIAPIGIDIAIGNGLPFPLAFSFVVVVVVVAVAFVAGFRCCFRCRWLSLSVVVSLAERNSNQFPSRQREHRELQAPRGISKLFIRQLCLPSFSVVFVVVVDVVVRVCVC